MSADRSVVGPEPLRRAAEPLAWWTVLLAVYLALASAVSVIEITVGAAAAAMGAAAAVAGRRALFTAETGRGAEHMSDGGRAPSAQPGAGRVPPLVWLPGQIVADTARIVVRGAGGGSWVPLAVAAGPTARGAATLLVSTSPGTYVGAVDPDRGLLRVHRLASGPSRFERRLAAAGLVAEPARPRGGGAP